MRRRADSADEKFPSPSGARAATFAGPPMRFRLLLSLLMLAAATSGCTLFRKSSRPKESSAISSEVEENFHRRWVEKRSAELVAQGVAAAAAQTQAENEFREKYDFSRPGRK